MTDTSDNGYDETIFHYDPSDPQKLLYWTAATDAACNIAHDKLDAMGVGELYAEKVCDAIREGSYSVAPPHTEHFAAEDLRIIFKALAVYKEEFCNPDAVQAVLDKLKRTQRNAK